MNTETFAQTLAIQYGYNNYVFKVNLDGLTDADALKQPAPAGNCVNWVAGHILQARGGTLAVLGQPLPFAEDKYARYVRGSAPITSADGTIALTEMVADFATGMGKRLNIPCSSAPKYID